MKNTDGTYESTINNQHMGIVGHLINCSVYFEIYIHVDYNAEILMKSLIIKIMDILIQ